MTLSVTRFAFVFPLKQTPSGKMFDYVVPCSAEDARSYTVMEWNAGKLEWRTSETVGPFGGDSDMDWEVEYQAALSAAEQRDLELAREYGVAR